MLTAAVRDQAAPEVYLEMPYPGSSQVMDGHEIVGARPVAITWGGASTVILHSMRELFSGSGEQPLDSVNQVWTVWLRPPGGYGPVLPPGARYLDTSHGYLTEHNHITGTVTVHAFTRREPDRRKEQP